MKLNMSQCHVCEREMALRTLDLTEGQEHELRVMFEGMPVMACSKGHKRFVVPDFAVRLMDALLEDDRLVPVEPASLKGLLRKRYGCPECHKDLDGGAKSHVRAKRVLELSGLDAFGVSVELPKFQCSACGREYVPPSDIVADALLKASARAFRAAAVSAT